jgi:hypothetical protein
MASAIRGATVRLSYQVSATLRITSQRHDVYKTSSSGFAAAVFSHVTVSELGDADDWCKRQHRHVVCRTHDSEPWQQFVSVTWHSNCMRLSLVLWETQRLFCGCQWYRIIKWAMHWEGRVRKRFVSAWYNEVHARSVNCAGHNLPHTYNLRYCSQFAMNSVHFSIVIAKYDVSWWSAMTVSLPLRQEISLCQKNSVVKNWLPQTWQYSHLKQR